MEDKARSDGTAQDLQWRAKCEVAILEWTERMIDAGTDWDLFEASALYLQPQDYGEVIRERSLANLCGYPPCCKRNRVTIKRLSPQSQQFCSKKCYNDCQAFVSKLPSEPLWIRAAPHQSLSSLDWNSDGARADRYQEEMLADKSAKTSTTQPQTASQGIKLDSSAQNIVKDTIVERSPQRRGPTDIPFGEEDVLEGHAEEPTCSRRYLSGLSERGPSALQHMNALHGGFVLKRV